MAFKLGDRTRETLASAPGTGNITTAGATSGAQSLASVLTSNGDTTWVTIDNGTAWETNTITRVSPGVYSRGTPFASSNAGALVNFLSGTIEVFIDIPASRLLVTVKKQIFIANGTYTPSTGMLYCEIETVGGGGGGGAAVGTAGQIYSGGGGGAGGYSRLLATAATIGASQAVTVGGGGAGGASGSNNGANGNDTSVGSLCIGKGGSGGKFGSSGQVPLPGAGGVAGTGDLTAAGAPGAAGFYNNAGITTAFPSGNGGSSFFGGGAIGVNSSGAAVAGNNGGNYGGGGSGAAAGNVTANAAGGNGSAGVVWITEYCSQ